jgi:hypothetical protein
MFSYFIIISFGSAGKGAIGTSSASSAASTGRFQAGLLALGSMHARFGHTRQALQVIFTFDLYSFQVRSLQNNDTLSMQLMLFSSLVINMKSGLNECIRMIHFLYN